MGIAATKSLGACISSSDTPSEHASRRIKRRRQKRDPDSLWHKRQTSTGHMGCYEILEELSCGADSRLLKVRSKASGRLFACRSIVKQQTHGAEKSSSNSEAVHKEVDILEHLSSQLTVELSEVVEDGARYHLVSELCQGGDLLDQAPASSTFSEDDVALLARLAASCIDHCHKRGVVHRNVCPQSFFWTGPEGELDACTGTSSSLEGEPRVRQLKLARFSEATFLKGDGHNCTSLRGSYLHAAPEMVRRYGNPSAPDYGAEVDLWALGVMLYSMLTGRMPFVKHSQDSTLQAIMHDSVDMESKPWPSISLPARCLVSKLLNKDPKSRLKARQVLAHPFITAKRHSLSSPRPATLLKESEPRASAPEGVQRWWTAQIALKTCRRAARRFVSQVLPIATVQQLLTGLYALRSAHGEATNRLGVGLLSDALAPLGAESLMSETQMILGSLGMELSNLGELQHFLEAVLQLLSRSPDELLRSILWNMKPEGTSRSVIRPADIAAFLAASDPVPHQLLMRREGERQGLQIKEDSMRQDSVRKESMRQLVNGDGGKGHQESHNAERRRQLGLVEEEDGYETTDRFQAPFMTLQQGQLPGSCFKGSAAVRPVVGLPESISAIGEVQAPLEKLELDSGMDSEAGVAFRLPSVFEQREECSWSQVVKMPSGIVQQLPLDPKL